MTVWSHPQSDPLTRQRGLLLQHGVGGGAPGRQDNITDGGTASEVGMDREGQEEECPPEQRCPSLSCGDSCLSASSGKESGGGHQEASFWEKRGCCVKMRKSKFPLDTAVLDFLIVK